MLINKTTTPVTMFNEDGTVCCSFPSCERTEILNMKPFKVGVYYIVDPHIKQSLNRLDLLVPIDILRRSNKVEYKSLHL